MVIMFDECRKYILLCFYFLFFGYAATAGIDTLNVKNYGAKGDGKTNDYWAFIKAANDINKRAGNCVLIVPKGNYFIGVYNSPGKTYQDIEFDSCTNISIIGFSAVVNIEGNYHRAADYITGVKKRITRSYTYSIIPFSFINCKNVILSGFEVNGNSDKVTKDPGVVESQSHLIRIWESENVKVRDMYLHHGISDGVVIGGKTKFSKNISFYNVVASSNARQAMSIVDARDAVFEKCQFINTGYFNGKYGPLNPSSGVDIEPIRRDINGVKTGNIRFIDCRFENNHGGQIRNGNAISVDSVFFIRDTIIAASSPIKFQLVLGCGYSEMNDCYIDIGNGIFYTTSMRSPNRQTSVINNSKIYIDSGQIISTEVPSRSAMVRFTNNKIYFKTQTGNNSCFSFKYGDVKFSNNEVYFPKSYFSSGKKDIYIGNERLKLHNAVKTLNN